MLKRYWFYGLIQPLLILTFGLLSIPSLLTAAEPRTWKAAAGNFQVEAELVKQTNSEVVLKKADGKEIRVRKDKLSAEDRQFLIQLNTKKPSEKGVQEAKENSDKKPPEPIADAPEEQKESSEEEPKATPVTSSPTFEWDLAEVREEDGIDYDAVRKQLLAVPAPPVWEKAIEFEAEITPSTAIISDNGQFLLSHDATQNMLTIWDLEKGKQHHQWKCDDLTNPQCLAISPRGKYLAIGSASQVVVTYDVENAKELYRHKALRNMGDTPYRVAFSWQENDVYFQGEKSGTFFRFPVAGGLGFGLPTFTFPPNAEDAWGMLQVSPDGNTINYKLAPGKIVMRASAMPKEENELPLRRSGELELEKPPLVSHAMNGGLLLFSNRLTSERFNYVDNDYGKFPNRKTQSLSSLVRSTPQQASIDQKEEHVWTWGPSLAGDLVVEIYRLEFACDPITLLPPIIVHPERGDKIWLSAEGRRWIRWDEEKKKIQVYRIASLEYPPTWKINLEIPRALRERRYDRIDGIVQPWIHSDITIPGGSRRPIIQNVIGMLTSTNCYETNGASRARLKAWQSAKPDSTLARLVVASLHISDGFDARGDGRANTVTSEGWAAFKREAEEAQKLLTPLMEQESPPASAFLLQLRVAMMQGWEVEKQHDLADRLLKLHPEFTPFHCQMVINLLPRWYGEPGDSMKYAEHVAEFLGEEKGELQYAYMATRLADYHPTKLLIEEAKVDPKRVLDAYSNQWKQDPKNQVASFLALSWCYYVMGTTIKDNIPTAVQMQELEIHVTQELAKINWNVFAAGEAFGSSRFLDNRMQYLRARKKNATP